jgi:dephospho-CoA kinase
VKKTVKLKKNIVRLNENSRLYSCPIPIIAITGGIASGKSTIVNHLSGKHLTISADNLVKEAYTLPEVLSSVRQIIPEAFLEEEINLKEVRRIVFQDNEKLRKLESILYPNIPPLFLSKISTNNEYLFYEIPLLFEKSLEKMVDYVITIFCSRDEQIKRIIERDGTNELDAERIIKSQMDLKAKVEKSDYTILNSTRDNIAIEIDKLSKHLFE